MNLVDLLIKTFDGEILEDNVWRINGSKGKHYMVEWHPHHNKYSCNCLGYTYRKWCRHITELHNSFKNRLLN